MRYQKIVIDRGEVKFLYSDELRGLTDRLGGETQIARCSHVEPEEGLWFADLSPVGGPKLGPFKLRQSALDAEVEWLQQHNLPDPIESDSDPCLQT